MTCDDNTLVHIGNNFTVEHLELTDITSLLADSLKGVEWKPDKVEETIFFMIKKS